MCPSWISVINIEPWCLYGYNNCNIYWHNVGYVNIFQLAEAVDETSFNAVIAGCEWRYDVDGLPHTIPFQQRKVFIDEVAKYFTIIKCKGMLDGLLEGLKYYEVLYTVNMYFMWLQNVTHSVAGLHLQLSDA